VLLQIQLFRDATPYRRESWYRSKAGDSCLHCLDLQTNCSTSKCRFLLIAAACRRTAVPQNVSFYWSPQPADELQYLKMSLFTGRRSLQTNYSTSKCRFLLIAAACRRTTVPQNVAFYWSPQPADELQYLKMSLFTGRRHAISLKSVTFSAREVTRFLQVKIQFTLEQTLTKTQMGSRCIAPLFL
jgi:hypothetical protein